VAFDAEIDAEIDAEVAMLLPMGKTSPILVSHGGKAV
jgi:hypothetical protein